MSTQNQAIWIVLAGAVLCALGSLWAFPDAGSDTLAWINGPGARTPELVLAIILGTFISEDLTSATAGVLAGSGIIGFFPALFASFLGIFLGDILLYLAGMLLGPRGLAWFLSRAQIERMRGWLSERGFWIILGSRFLPGSRLPVYLCAGMVKTRSWKFLIYFLVASALWTPLLVGVSAALGSVVLAYVGASTRYAPFAMIAVIFSVWLSLRLRTRSSKRELKSSS